MTERLVRTSYVDPTVDPPEPRQGDTGLHESRQDQEGYADPLHRLHGSALHGWGVATGLGVTATIGANGIRVAPGVALDARGRLLPLAPGGHARLDDGTPVPVTGDGAALPTAGSVPESLVTVGWAETFDFAGVASGVFNTETTPVLRLRPVAGFAHDGTEVVLARVRVDPGGRVTELRHDHRRGTVISVDRVEFRRPNVAASGGATTVVPEASAEARSLREGGLVLAADRVAVEQRRGGDWKVWVDTVDGRVGVGTTQPSASLDVPDLVARDRIAVGHVRPLGRIHAVGMSGFAPENPDGTSTVSDVPLLAQSDSTAIGILNASGRESFAINVEGNLGTPDGRGVPTLFDKYDGFWHPSIALRNGRVGIGTQNPATALEVHSAGGPAAQFNGDVHVTGQITKTALTFKIDHPLDPERGYLSHSAVESDEMKNVYDGEVTLDDDGAAEIALPSWFEALNERFRYQLTPVGGPAPCLHVSRKLSGNSFAIAGGEPGSEVCWQVTGVRHDPYALAHPLVPETEKAGRELGRFLHPEAHGKAADLSIFGSVQE
ncbi:hypothetical protein FDA94_09225 [Herbidospora galbida]|uniref:Uncharacterized protein n=1 Tax=Herbidospora galbida TaxID=2575442 RepID=A0A4U3MJL6_9ACTN|nr:hypothetical protein [Herbidospora galbida]TKK89561.1 hypothetical protein FDA94_09225 [Herbidospora galbida]